MRAMRVTIEVKDSAGQWFTAFRMPFEQADELRLPPEAAARIADAVQKRIAMELDAMKE